MTSRDKASLYFLPLDKKQNVIQKIYIRTPDIQLAWDTYYKILQRGNRVREGKTGFIIGESRSGKSETLKRAMFETTGVWVRKGEPYQLLEGNGVRIVFADLTNGSTPLVATQRILIELFQDPKAPGLKETEAAERLVNVFLSKAVDLFVIDETQQMFRGHGQWGAVKLGNWLLAIQNSNTVPTLCVGSPELRELFIQVPAIRDRKAGEAPLGAYPFSTEIERGIFGKFIADFERDVPFPTTCLTDGTGKCRGFRLLQIFYATRGSRGVLASLTAEATEAAFKREANPSALKLVDFEKAFDGLLKTDPRMMGVNPFAVPSEKELPTTFPRTPLEAEEWRLQMQFGGRNRRTAARKTPGGRISG